MLLCQSSRSVLQIKFLCLLLASNVEIWRYILHLQLRSKLHKAVVILDHHRAFLRVVERHISISFHLSFHTRATFLIHAISLVPLHFMYGVNFGIRLHWVLSKQQAFFKGLSLHCFLAAMNRLTASDLLIDFDPGLHLAMKRASPLLAVFLKFERRARQCVITVVRDLSLKSTNCWSAKVSILLNRCGTCQQCLASIIISLWMIVILGLSDHFVFVQAWRWIATWQEGRQVFIQGASICWPWRLRCAKDHLCGRRHWISLSLEWCRHFLASEG